MPDAVDELTYWRDEAERFYQESRDSASDAGRYIRERDEARKLADLTAEQVTAYAQIIADTRAEHAEVLERLHADYNDRLNAAHARTAEVESEMARYRRAVARLRELHVPKAYKLDDGSDWTSPGCAACEYAEPCPTIKAIEEATKP